MIERTVLGWLLIGIAAGTMSHVLAPRRRRARLVVAMLLGLAGALFAGFVGDVVQLEPPWLRDYVLPVVGAVALLLVYRLVLLRRTRRYRSSLIR